MPNSNGLIVSDSESPADEIIIIEETIPEEILKATDEKLEQLYNLLNSETPDCNPDALNIIEDFTEDEQAALPTFLEMGKSEKKSHLFWAGITTQQGMLAVTNAIIEDSKNLPGPVGTCVTIYQAGSVLKQARETLWNGSIVKFPLKPSNFVNIFEYACVGHGRSIMLAKEIIKNSKNLSLNIPLHLALYYQNLKLVKYLVEEAKAEITPCTSILAASCGNLAALQYFVEQIKIDLKNIVNERDKKNLLHYAATAGNEHLIQYLIKQGVDPEGLDHEDHMPAYYIAVYQPNPLTRNTLKIKSEIFNMLIGPIQDKAMQTTLKDVFFKSTLTKWINYWKYDLQILGGAMPYTAKEWGRMW